MARPKPQVPFTRQSFLEERLLIENSDLTAEPSVAFFRTPRSPRMTKVHAIASNGPLPIEDPASLIDIELDLPEPGPHDLRVRIEAVSVNPVDVRRRKSTTNVPAVFGYDASGVVEEVGSEVSLFSVGDEVFYAGTDIRQGTNADEHLVDERLVGRKPTTLNHAEAAALPLTSLTAWEALLKLSADSDGDLLILGAAGGVGSIMIQLAAKLTRLRVIATASRPETAEWVRSLGADEVVDHSGNLRTQIADVAPGGVSYLFSPQSVGRLPLFVDILAPFGEMVLIDDDPGDTISLLKPKALSLHWELMFTRSRLTPPDARQHQILNRVANLIDDGVLRTTLTETLTGLDAEHLRSAHAKIETGRTIGKIVIQRAGN
jgi:NADPH:quinone reductase